MVSPPGPKVWALDFLSFLFQWQCHHICDQHAYPAVPGSFLFASFTNWNLLSRRLLSRGLGSHLQPGSCSQQHLLTVWASCTAFPMWQFNTCVFFMMRDFVFLIGFEHKAGLISCICRSPQRRPKGALSAPFTLSPHFLLFSLPSSHLGSTKTEEKNKI